MPRGGLGKLVGTEVSWVWFAALGVALLGFAAMASSLFGPFIFDDIPLILGNPRVHSFEHWRDLVTGDLWDTAFITNEDGRTRGFWRPVVQFSYVVNWVLGDGDPFWFHLTNLAVHAANASLVLFALRRWVGDDIGACVGAAVFALHPVQTETVAWIAGRTDSFCCFGLLLGVHGFAGRLRGVRWAPVLELFGIAFALGSKESFVLLPVLSALEVWAFRGRAPPSRSLAVHTLGATAPHWALVAVYLALHQLFIRVEPLALGVTAQNRLPLFLEAWGRYVALLVWPDDLTLGRALFGFEAGQIRPHYAFAAVGALTLCVGVWSALGWRRAGPLSVAVWCSIALTLPVSGLVWLDYDVLVSPRFLYIPMLAIAMLVAAAVVATRAWQRRSTRGLLVGLLLLLGIRSFVRAHDFSDEQRFWRQEITHNPRYTSAQLYFVVREIKNGRPRAALGLAHAAFRELSGEQDIELARSHLVVPTLTALLLMTPDRDRETLLEVAHFARDVRERQVARLELPRLGISLRLGAGSIIGRALRGARHRLRVLEADAYSRLGENERALRVLGPALQECSRCWQVLKSAVPVAARAGRPALALTLVERAETLAPAGVMAEPRAFAQTAVELERRLRRSGGAPRERVAYLSFVGAYGEAYRVAREQYERAPSPALALTLAELGVLAGDEAGALEVLGPTRGSPAELAQKITQLKLMAGHLDHPRPEGHWLPEL